MAPEFFTLSGPSKPQPGPAKRNDGPPQGPPRGPPQGPPQGPPHGPPQGHPNGPPQGHPIVPPPPPRIMIPVDLRGGPAIQISDVSQDLLSESDMRGELTDYMVFRFEKMADKDGFDDDGRPKWPSWEKAIRTEDRSIPKQVAAEKIRQLNRNSKSVIDKKSSLTAPLKRQIDSTLEFQRTSKLNPSFLGEEETSFKERQPPSHSKGL
ncbi:hypothetical protein HD806DRAFT_476965 [Xylariaceae sp. AK1471]|nr:hypothetical protein HD806DRAFT_476965 [Xylariaceae sp. AK1471]